LLGQNRTKGINVQKVYHIALSVLIFLIGATVGVAVRDAQNPPKRNKPAVVITLQECPYEDGDPSGMPCVWANPDTGGYFVNDGHNYRD
jgi:hypothetical protein